MRHENKNVWISTQPNHQIALWSVPLPEHVALHAIVLVEYLGTILNIFTRPGIKDGYALCLTKAWK